MVRATLFVLGLMFACLPQAARAQDWGSCTSYSYLNHFDTRIRAEECVTIDTVEIHWRGGSALMRAIHPASTVMDDGAEFRAQLRDAAARIGVAIDEMGGPLRLDNITVLFTNLPSVRAGLPDEGFNRVEYIAAAASTFAHECPVTYYKGSHGTMDANAFVATLAHEVFHCVQYRTWRDMPDEDWLVEASAEYFAYLAKPDLGAGFVPQFDRVIATTPLDDIDYPAVVFYLWMGDKYGPPRVRQFLASTRSLDTAVDTDMWMAFAQSYFDRGIHLPRDGGVIASTPEAGATITIHGNNHVDIPAMIPYTLHNATYVFDANRSFTMTHAPLERGVRVLWKPEETWVEPLTSLQTCTGERRIRVIWGSTHSTSGGSMDVRSDPAGAATCTCPVGVWRETEASLHRFFEQSALGGGSELMSGGRTLTLNADHTGSFSYDSVVTDGLPRDDFWVRQTKTGGTHFTWRILSGRLFTVLQAGADNMLNLHNEVHSPGGVTVETRRAGAQSIGHFYACDDTGLHLRATGPGGPPVNAAPGFTVDLDFARAGGGR